MRRYSKYARFTLDRLDQLDKALKRSQSQSADRYTEAPVPHKLDHRVHAATVAQLVAEYEAGASSRQLEGHFGISRASIIKLLREADVTIRNQGLSPEQIDEAVQLYADGWSLAKIGSKLGVDSGTVWRRLREQGVRMRDSHGRST